MAQDTLTQVRELVALVEQGKILEAFDRFYDDNVSMQENANPPSVGKAVNRAREEQFVAMVKEVHENRAEAVTATDNRAAIHWVLEFTSTQGNRVRYDQIALQTWNDGKIVEERFFYDTGGSH